MFIGSRQRLSILSRVHKEPPVLAINNTQVGQVSIVKAPGIIIANSFDWSGSEIEKLLNEKGRFWPRNCGITRKNKLPKLHRAARVFTCLVAGEIFKELRRFLSLYMG